VAETNPLAASPPQPVLTRLNPSVDATFVGYPTNRDRSMSAGGAIVGFCPNAIESPSARYVAPVVGALAEVAAPASPCPRGAAVACFGAFSPVLSADPSIASAVEE
jgi:hypothetical protein